MSKGKKNTRGDFMDDPLDGIAHCLGFLHGLTPEEAQQKAREEVSGLLHLDEPAHENAKPSSFTDDDLIRARGMGVLLEFPEF